MAFEYPHGLYAALLCEDASKPTEYGALIGVFLTIKEAIEAATSSPGGFTIGPFELGEDLRGILQRNLKAYAYWTRITPT